MSCALSGMDEKEKESHRDSGFPWVADGDDAYCLMQPMLIWILHLPEEQAFRRAELEDQLLLLLRRRGALSGMPSSLRHHPVLSSVPLLQILQRQ